MLYLFGSSADSTTRYFVSEVAGLGVPFQWLDLASAVESRWYVDLDGGIEIRDGARRAVVPSDASVYARIVLPNHAHDEEGLDALASRRLTAALTSWLELSAGRVVNRPGHALDNASKPLHEALLIGAGFLVPASLTSSDPSTLRSFAETHSVVVKTISGIRADCRRVAAGDLSDFHPEQGPIHLQRAVDGLDVRVHVIGTQAIAVAVRSQAVDYRIADDARYFPFELSSDLQQSVVEATSRMGLAFAGWDFKLSDEDGRFYALEVNPMPGYHLYDRAVEGSITRALLDYFADGS